MERSRKLGNSTSLWLGHVAGIELRISSTVALFVISL